MPDSSNSEGREIIAPPIAKVGDILSAAQWNKMRAAIFNPLRGVNGGKQVEYDTVPLAIYQALIVANDNGNYLKCVFWNSIAKIAGNDLFAVAKPYLFQQSTLDGTTDANGIKYTFTSIDHLTALDTGSAISEDWRLNFPYTVGEIIYIFGNVNGGIDNEFPCDYIDSNNAGRMWGKVPT